MVDFLEKSELTASELREVAMLAAEIYESNHIRPLCLALKTCHDAWFPKGTK
jgi:hypothetical protein